MLTETHTFSRSSVRRSYVLWTLHYWLNSHAYASLLLPSPYMPQYFSPSSVLTDSHVFPFTATCMFFECCAIGLLSCWRFLSSFLINRMYMLAIHYWFDLMLTFSCVFLFAGSPCLESIIDLILMLTFSLVFSYNSLYVLGNHYWFDLILTVSLVFSYNRMYVLGIIYWFDRMLTVSLVFSYSQVVRALNFIIDLISCRLFLLRFSTNSLYVLRILYWYHLMLTVSLVFPY